MANSTDDQLPPARLYFKKGELGGQRGRLRYFHLSGIGRKSRRFLSSRAKPKFPWALSDPVKLLVR